MNLTRFEDFISQRKQVLSFKADVPQEELLLRLVSNSSAKISFIAQPATNSIYFRQKPSC